MIKRVARIEVAMLWLLLVLVIGSGSSKQSPATTVDLIELNHKYCETTGKLQFVQMIFWEWSPDYRRYDAVGWGLVNERIDLQYLPVKRGDWFVCSVVLSRNGTYSKHKFRAKLFRETHTNYDPETASRKLNSRVYRE